MCGIAGIWGAGDIRAMTRLLAHRGPDQEGYFQAGPVQLGSRRLIILDLQGGRQPMFNEDRSLALVFNGLIFNYKELREELRARGHFFQSTTDTEVILHGYEEWGEACLERFIGMFAFALYDGQRLWLARDRMGEKPLYYCRDGERFLFASEIKSLLSQVEAEVELPESFHVFETPIGGETLFRGIRSLEPAHTLSFDGQRLVTRRYWEIPEEPDRYHEESYYVEKLRWLIEDAVRIRLRSDVPVGAFLSGGLDSSLITCIARPEMVFTCRYPYGEKYDEFPYAQAVARHVGARQLVVQPSPEDFRRFYPSILWHLDQPLATASSIGEFSLARLACGQVKVVLGGQGADELFGGYVRYLLLLEEERLGRQDELRNYHSLARFFWSERLFGPPADRYFDLIQRGRAADDSARETVRALFARRRQLIDRMGLADLFITLPPLITMNDRAAAAFGLENRTPFLDHRIVELAFQLPPELKVREYKTKHILRQVARGLVPDEVIDRKDKKGLVVPWSHWFAGELKGWASELAEAFRHRELFQQLRDAPGSRGEFDRREYNLVSLELWCRQFLDGRPALPLERPGPAGPEPAPPGLHAGAGPPC